jgi:hypothetical protein
MAKAISPESSGHFAKWFMVFAERCMFSVQFIES